jgi:type IV secretory pathway TrbD component
MLVFVLPRAAHVVFLVNQISPVCVGVGRFSITGHAGLNRVPFRGRVHGRQLGPGTYRISARTAAGRVVRRVTLVVVGGSAPSLSELRSLRAANTCAPAGTRRSSSSGASSAGTGSTPGNDLQDAMSQAPKLSSGLGGPTPRGANSHTGVLGSTIEKTARAIQPLLVALLAVAIILLALASLPRVAVSEPRFNDVLVRHRAEIAGLGAAALVAVAVALLLA